MILVVLFVSIVSVATLNLAQLEAYTVNFDARCRQYFFFQGKEHYMYFFRKSNQFELWVVQNSSNYEVYASPQQEVLVFKWPGLTINGLRMDMVFHKGEIRYPLSLSTQTVLCKINEISGTSFMGNLSTDYEHGTEFDKYTLIAATLLCLMTLSAGIFVAIVTNFKTEAQTQTSRTFADTRTLYKYAGY